MPNAFAYVVLFGWPVIIFVFCRVFPPAQALVWSLVGGYLLLPHGLGVDFPLLPVFDKNTIPSLAFLVLWPLAGRAAVSRRPIAGAAAQPANTHPQPRRLRRDDKSGRKGPDQPATSTISRWLWIEWALVAMLLLGPAVTVMQNHEPVIAGSTFIRGLGTYDGFAMTLTAIMGLLPYFLARRYLAGPEAEMVLLKGFVVAGIAYSALALVEVRLSPQLSRWVYGYLAQAFDQAMRDGGFRPVVFLQHGLWLAIFFAMSIVAAFSVWRDLKIGKWLAAGLWLLCILVLVRSLGALAIALACVPLVLFLKPRSQLVVAAVVAALVLFYPVLRGSNLIPTTQIAEAVQSISDERSRSLVFRLTNEDQLLARANEKPLGGWGSEGRPRIYDASGRDVSVTDGIWIITIGTLGWLGYIGQFGLLTIPILLRAVQGRRAVISLPTAGLSLVLVANLFDLIPNASLTPLTWIIAGSLAGSLRRESLTPAQAPDGRDVASDQMPAVNPYSRSRP